MSLRIYQGTEFADLPRQKEHLKLSKKVLLFAVFVVLRAWHPVVIDASKTVDIETGHRYFAYGDMTVVIGETLLTICVGSLTAIWIGGLRHWRMIWRLAPLQVFSFIGFFLAIGDYLEMVSMDGLTGPRYQVILQSKPIITAFMMWGAAGKTQTLLQWNILLVIVLAMVGYIIGQSQGGISVDSGMPFKAILFTQLKVCCSCFSAVLSDSRMKQFDDEPFYLQLVQFKFAWLGTVLMFSIKDGDTWQNGFFYGWDWLTWGTLISFTIKGWSTMYFLRTMDSVLKNIGEAFAVLLVYLVHVFLPNFEEEFRISTFLSVLLVVFSGTAYLHSNNKHQWQKTWSAPHDKATNTNHGTSDSLERI